MLSSIRIVTDSTADIPASVRELLGIEMVPLKVHIDGETYLDYIDLQAETFYKMLPNAKAFPKTSQPSPAEFVEVYKRLLLEPDTEIISIHVSSALSGTYQSAVLASSLLEQEGAVTVIDSKTVTYGSGMLAIAAAKAASEGKSKAEIFEIITKLRENTRIYFLVDTLEYLQKGGRIGKASAMLGSLLNIKPILSIDQDGEVYSVDKVRGQKRALSRMLELIGQEFGNEPIHIALKYTNNLHALEEIEELMKQQFQVESVQYTSIGPVIGAHVGPGTSGIVITRV